MNLTNLISVAAGREPADTLFTNGELVNVFSGEIYKTSVAVKDGFIAGFGDYLANKTVDLEGRIICPGFIDGHLHLESSMLAIPEFARNVIPWGTTTVVADPHEIANVLGVEGIRYVLDSSAAGPLKVFIMFPSCVPATPFETSGAELGPQDMLPFINDPRVLGLAEMMNFPGVIFTDPGVMAKLKIFEGRVIDGHAPGLTGRELSAYAAAGIGSDHECTTLEEAAEKLRNGISIMIREGSAAKDLDALLPLMNAHNSAHCMFVTDDLEPVDILEHGHINRLIKRALSKGMDPVRAIQAATINTARYFGLKRLGAVLPGYKADFVVLNNLSQFEIAEVYIDGQLAARDGKAVFERQVSPTVLANTFDVNWDKIKGLRIPAVKGPVNIIGVVPGRIVTSRLVEQPLIEDGCIVQDTNRDLLKIAVIERHKGTGNYAVGLIKGFGLKRGALAGSVAHDHHNIIVVGADDSDMLLAAHAVADMGGGLVVTDSGKVVARLPLPIAGLMSDKGIHEVRDNLEILVKSARDLGCGLHNPFAVMSFMALSPIPELKITDLGLFDSLNFKFTSLEVEWSY